MKIKHKLSCIFLIFIMFLLMVFLPTKVQAFEESIKNSTGFAAVNLNFRQKASSDSKKLGTINAGEPFLILEDKENYWKISYKDKIGYVYNQYCMINLPDVEPSIIYNITNADKSIYKSSGYDLPDVTGKKLYKAGKTYNEKLDRKEFIVPVSYPTAKKISKAQSYASKDGYTLKIYDAYRPTGVSKKIKNSLSVLYNSNNKVRNNINYSYGKSGRQYYWGQGWFLAQGVSTHNTGSAIDVTLANKKTGKELAMPTKMHELSTKAIKYYSGSVAKNTKNYSKEMNNNAKKLDNYCTKAGLNTLASEWWHFEDRNAHNKIYQYLKKGCSFQPNKIVSK